MITDYELLGKAQKFYRGEGFKFIESPWLVSSETINITAPSDVARYVVTKGDKVKEFVASGEQGFLYLALKGYLPPGKYATITPCLRNDSFDFVHLKQFMKCELINLLEEEPVESDIEELVYELHDKAAEFFLDNGLVTYSDSAGEKYQIDLTTDGGTEVGSYGYRSHQGLHWIYGTGLAEPRFSRVRDLL